MPIVSDVGTRFVAEQLPISRQKTLGYMSSLLRQIHEAAVEGNTACVRFLAMAGICMNEQFCLDENWSPRWRLFGLQTAPWTDWMRKRRGAGKGGKGDNKGKNEEGTGDR